MSRHCLLLPSHRVRHPQEPERQASKNPQNVTFRSYKSLTSECLRLSVITKCPRPVAAHPPTITSTIRPPTSRHQLAYHHPSLSVNSALRHKGNIITARSGRSAMGTIYVLHLFSSSTARPPSRPLTPTMNGFMVRYLALPFQSFSTHLVLLLILGQPVSALEIDFHRSFRPCHSPPPPFRSRHHHFCLPTLPDMRLRWTVSLAPLVAAHISVPPSLLYIYPPTSLDIYPTVSTIVTRSDQAQSSHHLDRWETHTNHDVALAMTVGEFVPQRNSIRRTCPVW